MQISPIASGSNGNCTFIDTGSERILVDMGITFKELVERMHSIGKDPYELDACFISHEHIDHVRGIGVLSRKLGIPIYMNQETYRSVTMKIGNISNVAGLNPTVALGKSIIHSFSKPHDAADPVSFVIESSGKRFGIITDTGYPCQHTCSCLNGLDAVLLEANYDPNILHTCSYPIYLKRRIAGERGHLSNEDSGLLVLEHASPRLKTIFLAHLSANSNHPDVALQTFKGIISHRKDLMGAKVILTSRDGCAGLYEI